MPNSYIIMIAIHISAVWKKMKISKFVRIHSDMSLAEERTVLRFYLSLLGSRSGHARGLRKNYQYYTIYNDMLKSILWEIKYILCWYLTCVAAKFMGSLEYIFYCRQMISSIHRLSDRFCNDFPLSLSALCRHGSTTSFVSCV